MRSRALTAAVAVAVLSLPASAGAASSRTLSGSVPGWAKSSAKAGHAAGSDLAVKRVDCVDNGLVTIIESEYRGNSRVPAIVTFRGLCSQSLIFIEPYLVHFLAQRRTSLNEAVADPSSPGRASIGGAAQNVLALESGYVFLRISEV